MGIANHHSFVKPRTASLCLLVVTVQLVSSLQIPDVVPTLQADR